MFHSGDKMIVGVDENGSYNYALTLQFLTVNHNFYINFYFNDENSINVFNQTLYRKELEELRDRLNEWYPVDPQVASKVNTKVSEDTVLNLQVTIDSDFNEDDIREVISEIEYVEGVVSVDGTVEIPPRAGRTVNIKDL